MFGSLYRPPNFDASVFSQEVESILVNYLKDENEIISLGDFNFDFALPLSGYQQKAKNFLQITRAFNLTQTICECTRITEHSRTLIDLFFDSRQDLNFTVPVWYQLVFQIIVLSLVLESFTEKL